MRCNQEHAQHDAVGGMVRHEEHHHRKYIDGLRQQGSLLLGPEFGSPATDFPQYRQSDFPTQADKLMSVAALFRRSSDQRGTAITEFGLRSEEHTSALQSLMRISYAVFCSKKKNHST